MRVLYKTKHKDVILDIEKIEYDTCFDIASIFLISKEIFVCIRVPINHLEKIKVALLRNGYYDFREYETSTSKF